MRYALHSFYYSDFLWSLFRVPIITKNRNNYRSSEIDILLVLNQLIIHVLQAGIFITGNIANEFLQCLLNTKCP